MSTYNQNLNGDIQYCVIFDRDVIYKKNNI